MQFPVDSELRALASEIVSWIASEAHWREFEGDDLFQSPNYCGGYEALEEAFTFSYYDSERREWWFQLTADEVQSVAEGQTAVVVTREPA
jgi:hypothetical protein